MKKMLVVTVLLFTVFVVSIPQASAQAEIIYACYNNKSGAMRYLTRESHECKRNETVISWNTAGPPGVVNGITRALHGTVDQTGTRIRGTGFEATSYSPPNPSPSCYMFDFDCNITIYTITFDSPFIGDADVTCTITAGPPVGLEAGGSYNNKSCQILYLDAESFKYTCTDQYGNHATTVSFICVQ